MANASYYLSAPFPANVSLPLFTCIACAYRYFPDEKAMKEHVRSDYHLGQMAKNAPREDPTSTLPRAILPVDLSRPPRFFCTLCSEFVRDDYARRSHSISRVHENRVYERSLPPLAPLAPLPAPTSTQLQLINEAIDELFEQKAMNAKDDEIRETIRTELESHIRGLPGLADGRLELFGSSRSGFGSHNSDLDLAFLLPQGFTEHHLHPPPPPPAEGTPLSSVLPHAAASPSLSTSQPTPPPVLQPPPSLAFVGETEGRA